MVIELFSHSVKLLSRLVKVGISVVGLAGLVNVSVSDMPVRGSAS